MEMNKSPSPARRGVGALWAMRSPPTLPYRIGCCQHLCVADCATCLQDVEAIAILPVHHPVLVTILGCANKQAIVAIDLDRAHILDIGRDWNNECAGPVDLAADRV